MTQLIFSLVENLPPITVIDGGSQNRCFIDVNDGIESLYRIIENRNHICVMVELLILVIRIIKQLFVSWITFIR